jgi:hypothetical protein
MTWPTSDSGDFLSGKPAKTGGRDLWDRARLAMQSGTTYYFAEVTHTTGAYADKVTYQVRIPEGVRSGDKIQLTILGYYSGAGSGNYRARETGTPVNGTEQALGGSYAVETSEITIPDNTWAGTVKNIAVQLETITSGTSYAMTGGDRGLAANLRFKATLS